MANTYTQIHIHTVFSVKNRSSLIKKEWQDRLYQYIIAIIIYLNRLNSVACLRHAERCGMGNFFYRACIPTG